MKLKSLLLGSAAVLALSTGAQAADPIPATFVSLGVCDAYGISGLTIESDDTCLSISGEVSYEYYHEEIGGVYEVGSVTEWELIFEATTQTDAGAAVAYIGLEGDSTYTGLPMVGADSIGFSEAYVQFGDTTVLSAGKKDKILDTEVLDHAYGNDELGDFDWDFDENDLVNPVTQGGHVITIESLVADGFTVIAGLEDLEGDGTALLGVEYDGGMFSAEAAVLLGDLYGATDPVNFYAAVTAEFDSFEVRGGVIFDDTGYWIASLGASATLDMFSLDTDAFFEDNGDWGVAGEGSFDATDTVAVYIGAGYQEVAAVDIFTVYAGVDADVTETIAANAELGYTDNGGADYIYGAAGLTYAPGGGFETSINAYANTVDDYRLSFEASKEF
ncbi:porin [Pelagibacterium flavum]|uniref:Porin n=1 Tax=Pelagibacterium flavum TaxID=2984530 RepID=A0ABY6IJP0_9HYPH|nr:porin [Pelagibacterium sp. YIM 151497]UYQ70783.1 porin [Pelagibacterium sp. YIM 151497]